MFVNQSKKCKENKTEGRKEVRGDRGMFLEEDRKGEREGQEKLRAK